MDLEEVTVVAVESWRVDHLTSPGTWPCATCGAPHTVADSWRVVADTDRGRTSLIVCRRCAERARADPGQ